MNGFLLDTHYWLWFQMGNAERLNLQSRHELLETQRGGDLYLSDVSVWEVARLVVDGHVVLGMSVDDFVKDGVRDGGLRLLPIATRILIESTRLPGDIHRDPADRLLVATAREHGLTLVTRDKGLLEYGRRGFVKVRKV